MSEQTATTTVVMNGREFNLSEPQIDVAQRLINIVGDIGLRMKKEVAGVFSDPDKTTAIFALLSVMSKSDMERLAVAVLQFEDERAGLAWLRKSGGVKLGPLIKAIMINFTLSAALIEDLKSFFAGMGNLSEAIGAMMPQTAPPQEAPQQETAETQSSSS